MEREHASQFFLKNYLTGHYLCRQSDGSLAIVTMKPTATKTRGNVARQTRASFQEEINIAIKTPTNMKIDCTIVATVCCMDCPKVSTSLVSLDMMSPAEEESKYFKGMLLILAIISLLSCSVYLIATVVNTMPEIKEEIEESANIEIKVMPYFITAFISMFLLMEPALMVSVIFVKISGETIATITDPTSRNKERKKGT